MDDDNDFGHFGSSHFDTGPTMPEMSMPEITMPSVDMPSMDASGFASADSGGGGVSHHHGLMMHHGRRCCHRRFCHGRCGGYRGGYRPAPPQRVTVVESACPHCSAAVPTSLGPCVHKCAACGRRMSVHYGARKRGTLAIVVGMFLGGPMALMALMWIVFGSVGGRTNPPFDAPAYMLAAFVLMALAGCAVMLLGWWLRRLPNAVQRPAAQPQVQPQPDAAPGFEEGSGGEPPPPAYPGYSAG